MVKAKMTGADGRPLFVFGLSEKNLHLLREGKPIKFSLEPFGGTGEVLIMYGKTEADIAATLHSATEPAS